MRPPRHRAGRRPARGAARSSRRTWATTKTRRKGSTTRPSRSGYAARRRRRNSSSNAGRRSSGSACSVGRAPVPETQVKTGSGPVRTWRYVVSQASTRAAEGGQAPRGRRRGRGCSGPRRRGCGRRTAPRRRARYGSCGWARRSCPAPGTRAIRPGAPGSTSAGSRSRWPGTHWRVALETRTSTGSGVARPTRGGRRPRRRSSGRPLGPSRSSPGWSRGRGCRRSASGRAAAWSGCRGRSRGRRRSPAQRRRPGRPARRRAGRARRRRSGSARGPRCAARPAPDLLTSRYPVSPLFHLDVKILDRL